MRLPGAVPSTAMHRAQSDDSSPKDRQSGRPVCQIELCNRHAEALVARERKRGFEIFDRRDWR